MNAADFSIAQFRFLERLLLVHGRWDYRRTCHLPASVGFCWLWKTWKSRYEKLLVSLGCAFRQVYPLYVLEECHHYDAALLLHLFFWLFRNMLLGSIPSSFEGLETSSLHPHVASTEACSPAQFGLRLAWSFFGLSLLLVFLTGMSQMSKRSNTQHCMRQDALD